MRQLQERGEPGMQGSLSASTKQNALYWMKGNSVVKYDVTTKALILLSMP